MNRCSGIIVAPASKLSRTEGALAEIIGARLERQVIQSLLGLALLIGAVTAALGAPPAVLSPGANYDGTVLANQASTTSLTASVGDRLILELGKTTGGAGFTPQMEVFGPDGGRIAAKNGAQAVRIDFQATAAGTYTVVVTDARQVGTGTYRLQFLRLPGTFAVPSTDEGGALANGANQTGTIDVGDFDPWTFTANTGDRVVLQIAETAGGANFAPLIELFAPDGTRIAFDSGNTAARIDVQAASAGTYTVVVSDANVTGTGSYQLILAQVPEPFTVPANDEGGPLPDGPDASGTITLGDLDLWTFTSDAGFKINLSAVKVTGGPAFTPKLEVFAPDGTRKAFKQDLSSPAVDFATEVGGTYTVLISDANGTGSGTYRITLTRAAVTVGGPGFISNGGTVNGNIATAKQEDRYTFTASTGESLIARVGKAGTSKLVPQIRLFGTDGTQIGTATSTAAAEIGVRATNSGTYTIAVRDSNAGPNTGGYTLSLAKTGSPLVTSPNDEGGALTNGMTQLGTIDVGELDTWSVFANAGDSLIIRAGKTSPSLVPQLRLFDPSGTLLDNSGGTSVAEVSVTATNSGMFLVVVADQSTSFAGSGTYQLSLAKTGSPLVILPSDEGGPMTNGLTHVGSIDIGDLDAWSFTANVGDNIVVRMGKLVAGGFNPQLRMFDPSGKLLDSAAGSAAAEVTARATNSGAFLVVAGDQSTGLAGSGNYRLTLLKTGSPLVISPTDEGGPLTNGTTFVGSIDVGDLDGWVVNANSGESIIVRMGQATPGVVPQLRIFDPSGTVLDSGAGSVAAEVAIRATNSGPFLIIAGDQSTGLAGSGNYRLTMAKTGSPLVISPTDEGGTLSNGTLNLGSIDIGDIDAWTFNANVGDDIVIRMGRASGNVVPQLRLFDPSGVQLQAAAGTVAAEISERATNSGAFLLIAADQNTGFGGSGNYRLTYVKSGSALVLAPGQDGGRLSGTTNYDGNLDVGSLDSWSFTACAGDTITVSMKETVSSSSLVPWIRIIGRDGKELANVAAQGTAQVSLTAPASGAYFVVLTDRNTGFGGSGAYQLTVNGLIDNLRICVPSFYKQGGFFPTVIGGTPAASLVVFTASEVTTPLSQWTPISTNQFDQFGTFSIDNAFNSKELKRFYTIRTP